MIASAFAEPGRLLTTALCPLRLTTERDGPAGL